MKNDDVHAFLGSMFEDLTRNFDDETPLHQIVAWVHDNPEQKAALGLLLGQALSPHNPSTDSVRSAAAIILEHLVAHHEVSLDPQSAQMAQELALSTNVAQATRVFALNVLVGTRYAADVLTVLKEDRDEVVRDIAKAALEQGMWAKWRSELEGSVSIRDVGKVSELLRICVDRVVEQGHPLHLLVKAWSEVTERAVEGGQVLLGGLLNALRFPGNEDRASVVLALVRYAGDNIFRFEKARAVANNLRSLRERYPALGPMIDPTIPRVSSLAPGFGVTRTDVMVAPQPRAAGRSSSNRRSRS